MFTMIIIVSNTLITIVMFVDMFVVSIVITAGLGSEPCSRPMLCYTILVDITLCCNSSYVMRMYVYIYIYIYIYTHICVYTDTHTYIYIYIYMPCRRYAGRGCWRTCAPGRRGSLPREFISYIYIYIYIERER